MKARLSWIVEVLKAKPHYTTASDEASVVFGVSTDSRTIEENQLFVPLVGEHFDGHRFLDKAVSQGAVASLWQKDHPMPEQVDIPLILVEDTLQALQQLAHVYRMTFSIPVIAITGSNGKTTTKDLVASVLQRRFRVHKTKGNLNNHIGLPLTLLSMDDQTEVAVIEMGMNNKGEIALLSQIARPTHAIVTNIGESHIEFLGSREGIADAKLEILEGLATDGVLVFDGDEPLILSRIAGLPQKMLSVGWNRQNEDYPEKVEPFGDQGYRFWSHRGASPFVLPILGKHNIVNSLYAINIGRELGLSEEEIAEGLSQVTLTGMRLERMAGKNDLTIINDAYNASPTSTKAALRLLSELEPEKEKWALLGEIREIGGEWEQEYHRELGRYAVEMGVSRLLTVGEKGKWIAEGAEELRDSMTIEVLSFTDRDDATKWLLQHAHPNAVLLVKASRAAQLDLVAKAIAKED